MSLYVKGFYYIPPLGDAGITLMSTVEAGGPSADSPWSFSKSSERVDPKRRYFQLRKKNAFTYFNRPRACEKQSERLGLVMLGGIL